jgi:hypothetical protein
MGNIYVEYKNRKEAEASYMNHLAKESKNWKKTFIVVSILFMVIVFLCDYSLEHDLCMHACMYTSLRLVKCCDDHVLFLYSIETPVNVMNLMSKLCIFLSKDNATPAEIW